MPAHRGKKMACGTREDLPRTRRWPTVRFSLFIFPLASARTAGAGRVMTYSDVAIPGPSRLGASTAGKPMSSPSTISLTARQRTAAADLHALLEQRIAILEGPKGTMVQAHNLSDAHCRGDRLRSHPRDLKGNNGLLNLTRPAIIEEFHRAFIDAGADIV